MNDSHFQLCAATQLRRSDFDVWLNLHPQNGCDMRVKLLPYRRKKTSASCGDDLVYSEAVLGPGWSSRLSSYVRKLYSQCGALHYGEWHALPSGVDVYLISHVQGPHRPSLLVDISERTSEDDSVKAAPSERRSLEQAFFCRWRKSK
jgi:hypothetical protein